jgi:hypothetical protein
MSTRNRASRRISELRMTCVCGCVTWIVRGHIKAHTDPRNGRECVRSGRVAMLEEAARV